MQNNTLEKEWEANSSTMACFMWLRIKGLLHSFLNAFKMKLQYLTFHLLFITAKTRSHLPTCTREF